MVFLNFVGPPCLNDQAKLIAHMTGMMNGASISIQGNQIFVVFDTNEEIVKKGFNASIIQGW